MKSKEEYIIDYTKVTIERYKCNTEEAKKIAEKALNAFESHGGSFKDLDGMKKVIEIVVNEWIVDLRDSRNNLV